MSGAVVPSSKFYPMDVLVGYAPRWVGQFDTYHDWLTHQDAALCDGPGDSNGKIMPAVCIDAKGHRCVTSDDFVLSWGDDAYPVRYFWDFRETRG
jgi:hypothetical protein